MENRDAGLIIMIIVLMAAFGAYAYMQPSYKAIEMSGYQLEVPNSDVSVENTTSNYNQYRDSKNNLTIRTWAWKDTHDFNLNGSVEIGEQWGKGISTTNATKDNISVYNKTGTYTYYDMDMTKGTMIVITTDNFNDIIHTLKTMNKSTITPADNNIISMTLNNTTEDNQTENNQTNTKSKAKSTTSSKKKSTSSSNTINGEEIVVRHDYWEAPDAVEYIGTENNVYLREKSSGKTYKRYLDRENWEYYFK